MRENGWVNLEKVMEFNFGKMVQNMKVIGKIIRHVEKVFLSMQMEIHMKEIGLMTKQMDTVYIFM